MLNLIQNCVKCCEVHEEVERDFWFLEFVSPSCSLLVADHTMTPSHRPCCLTHNLNLSFHKNQSSSVYFKTLQLQVICSSGKQCYWRCKASWLLNSSHYFCKSKEQFLFQQSHLNFAIFVTLKYRDQFSLWTSLLTCLVLIY